MQARTLYQAFTTVPRTAYALASVLGVFTVLAWLVVAQANMPMAGTLDPVALTLFTAIWGVGMVAMMFPSLVPIAFAVRVSTRKFTEEINASVSLRRFMVIGRTALFVGGYVAIWTLVGVLFYLAIAGFSLVGLPYGVGVVGPLAGGIMIFTGLYQFSKFKRQALMKCRSPVGFLMTRWKSGSVGAGLMGLDYGLFCTKCCWVLMVGLLTVGTMSLPLMGIFALIIFVEKIGPFGTLVVKIVGLGFLAAGIALIVLR